MSTTRQRKLALLPFEKKNSAQKTLTVLWADLPNWQRDNHYIHSGYRPASNSFHRSIASLLYLHNESFNVYSHLLGGWAISAIGLCLLYLKSIAAAERSPKANAADIQVFACFFAGAAACLEISASFHLLSNHSSRIARLGNSLDYVGIVCLIVGSFVPSIYYGFYCHRSLQILYWTMISGLGLGCATVSLLPLFRTPAWRPFRAGMFSAMGLSAIIPVLHGIQIYGLELLKTQIGLYWLITQGALYIFGAALYAIKARIPERLKPGYFDIWGSSHQIFHILVVTAALVHLKGLLVAFDYHHKSGVNACH